MNYQDVIIEFLEQPGINVSGIESEAKIPPTTLSQVIKGKKEIPLKHLQKLVGVCAKYGFRPRANILFFYPEDKTIIAKFYGKEEETIWINEGQTPVNKVSVFNNLIGDVYDLIEFLEGK